jgi:hypothetical protein
MRDSPFGMWCCALLCVVVASGCSTFRLAPVPPPVYTQALYTPEAYQKDRDAYETLWGQATHEAPDPTMPKRTALRDKIVYATAKEIDKNYTDFKSSFFGERAALETGLDIVQIGLGSAGTLAGGELTKAILAATATGVAGMRLSYNQNFFKEKTPDILLSRMDALRAERWSQLYRQLSGSTDETYPLSAAERDLVAYYQAGSLEAAFQSIIAESGAALEQADTEIKRQIEEKYGGPLGRLAGEEERKEIRGLYQEFLTLKEPERDKRAQKVLANFRRLQPERTINIDDPEASNLDNVKYLYSLAIRENYPDVRRDLMKAFVEARAQ